MKRFTTRNDPFTCEHCGKAVPAGTRGVMRNHCAFCLYGKHVDDHPGDRQATCGGLMQPVHAFYQAKQIVLVHRCQRCGIERHNRAAMPPCATPDDLDVILALMRKSAESVM